MCSSDLSIENRLKNSLSKSLSIDGNISIFDIDSVVIDGSKSLRFLERDVVNFLGASKSGHFNKKGNIAFPLFPNFVDMRASDNEKILFFRDVFIEEPESKAIYFWDKNPSSVENMFFRSSGSGAIFEIKSVDRRSIELTKRAIEIADVVILLKKEPKRIYIDSSRNLLDSEALLSSNALSLEIKNLGGRKFGIIFCMDGSGRLQKALKSDEVILPICADSILELRDEVLFLK